MPYDSYGSGMEAQIEELSEYISALSNAPTSEPLDYVINQFTHDMKMKILKHLASERDSIKRQLDQHRRRDQERGIKY